MTIPSMIKKSFHQPTPDALVKIEITEAGTDNVPRPLGTSLRMHLQLTHLNFNLTCLAFRNNLLNTVYWTVE